MVIKGKYLRTVTDQEGNQEVTFQVRGYLDKQIAAELEQVDYRISLKELKSKRSIQQNALMWELIHEIGIARGTERSNDDWEIYLEALIRSGAKFEYYACMEGAEELLRQNSRAIEKYNSFELHGVKMNTWKVYYGSSQMTTEEMSNLLETVMDMAAEEGINV